VAVELTLLGAGLAAGFFLAWWVASSRRGASVALDDRLTRVAEQLDRRLAENARAMNESKSFLADRVTSSERSVREVIAGLSKLAATTEALKSNTDEISSFQNLLKSPKVRGSFGEVLLQNLMADVLPHDRYETQYTLRGSGEVVDAIIKLQDSHIVAIDAKFPLANFELFAREQDPVKKRQAHAAMMRDIKKHITDISHKYIAPRDRTLDYAFMYIPVESIYYETIVRDEAGDDLWDFCLKQKVVPVSPNSFLAYLQTVLVGLRGMKIEQQAKEILEHLSQLRRDFKRFAEDYATVGTHLSNAQKKYDESGRRLGKFETHLETIEADQSKELPPEAVDKA
jgi:DNA recombination protein RmuC